MNKQRIIINSNKIMHRCNYVRLISASPTPKSSSKLPPHAQISQKLEQYNESTITNDQLPTARIHDRPFRTPQSVSRIKIPKDDESIDDSNLEPQLQQFKNQLSTHYDVIVKLSHVIDFLKQENKELSFKLVQADNNLEEIESFYLNKLQEASNRIKELEDKDKGSRQATHNNSVVYVKPGKVTPLKIYSKGTEQKYTFGFVQQQQTGLQDLYKMMVYQCVNNFQKQVNKLQELCQEQSKTIQTISAQQKYTQAYIQDQILNHYPDVPQNSQLPHVPHLLQQTKKFNNAYPTEMSDILHEYKDQIISWQNYASSLKKQLIDCINFIQKFITTKELKKVHKKPYTNKELILYISQQINGKVRKMMKGMRDENRELRVLLDQAFQQLKSYRKQVINQPQHNETKGDILKYLP